MPLVPQVRILPGAPGSCRSEAIFEVGREFLAVFTSSSVSRSPGCAIASTPVLLSSSQPGRLPLRFAQRGGCCACRYFRIASWAAAFICSAVIPSVLIEGDEPLHVSAAAVVARARICCRASISAARVDIPIRSSR